MKAWKIGFVALTMALAGACGSDSSSEGEGTDTGGDATTTGSQTSTTGAQTSTTGSQAGSSTGGSTTGGGTTTGGTTGATGGGTTGAAGMGACTNAADKAIIDAATVPKLACEGAACVGNNIAGGDAALEKCIANDAPTLKMLSKGCQKCFQQITNCVPSKCLKFPPAYNGTGECPISAPNTDYKKCPLSTPPDAKCQECQTRECAPAFTTCSGLTM